MATILIVEDESSIARRMVSLMRNAGHTPVLAPGGHAALRAVELRPHVIVLDFGVRNGQGEDLVQRLVRTPEAAHTPVVIVAGDAASVARFSASKPPWLADIVMKPIDSHRLSQAVQTALARNGNGADSKRQSDAVVAME